MRAIILAAGMGTRLRPLTLTTPKSLIEIDGETLIERQIRFLKEKSINEIIVVIGYLSEKFEFLKEKYSVTLVVNDKYDIHNNFYTMYLVKDYLSECYVIDADNYLVENILADSISRSTYFSAYKKDFSDEWLIESNEHDKVTNIIIASGEGRILSGVSYWDKVTGGYLKSILEDYYHQDNYSDLYWDDLVKNHLKDIDVYIQKLEDNQMFEIDNLDDLENLKDFLKRESIIGND